jgi:hypothetical protein
MPRDAGYIYAIQAVGPSSLKIGYTKRPVAVRLAALQHASPRKVIACAAQTPCLRCGVKQHWPCKGHRFRPYFLWQVLESIGYTFCMNPGRSGEQPRPTAKRGRDCMLFPRGGCREEAVPGVKEELSDIPVGRGATNSRTYRRPAPPSGGSGVCVVAADTCQTSVTDGSLSLGRSFHCAFQETPGLSRGECHKHEAS